MRARMAKHMARYGAAIREKVGRLHAGYAVGYVAEAKRYAASGQRGGAGVAIYR